MFLTLAPAGPSMEPPTLLASDHVSRTSSTTEQIPKLFVSSETTASTTPRVNDTDNETSSAPVAKSKLSPNIFGAQENTTAVTDKTNGYTEDVWSPATKLKNRLEETKDLIVCPGVYDGFSARIALSVGFDTIYMTGAGTTASRLGMADLGIASRSDMKEHADMIANLDPTKILIADMDTGYEGPVTITETVNQYIRANVAGFHIEDQVLAKRCGHLSGEKVVSHEIYISRIRAAKAAKDKARSDIVLIARIDANQQLGYDECISRLRAAREHGADVGLLEGFKSKEEACQAVRDLAPWPLLLNIVENGHSPLITVDEARDMGFRIIIFSFATLSSACVFDLTRCYSRLWRALPENAKSGNDPKFSTLIDESLEQVKNSYQDLLKLLHPDCDKPAISDSHYHKHLSHRALSRFIKDFRLPVPIYNNTKPTIVIALPNGPLLALACLAVATYYTAAPINSTSGAEQFRNDVLQTHSKTILICRSDLERLELYDSWIAEASIEVFVVDEEPDMTFDLSPLNKPSQLVDRPRIPNRPDDLAFILYTSGTSGTKKLVPLSLHNLVSGVAFVIESWHLTKDDVCLNMMPLNHVGGLVRNLFAPILAGGSTICCPAFDPNLFWDVVEAQDPTWYYASPSMHSTILAEAGERRDALSKSRMRLVCNAAGGLLPSLALRIQNAFKCTVLPSYGMTECMPISTPPIDYKMDRPGTSGVSVGPEISILDGADNHLPHHTNGRIAVRGPPLFPGYLMSGRIDRSCFNKSGWFDTGDMGYLDEDGYLYVTGRSKEVVNRGGELISPLEVEEAIMIAASRPESQIYGRVTEAMVFSAPHEVLQEVLGVVIVTPEDKPRPDIRQLHEALRSSLHQSKWPVVIVYMDALPTKNNKMLRIRLGERFGIEPLTDEVKLAERHFEAVCPPPDTPLTERIEKIRCPSDFEMVARTFRNYFTRPFYVHVGESHHDGLPEVALVPQEPGDALKREIALESWSNLHEKLHGYMVPSTVKYLEQPLPLDQNGEVDIQKLKDIMKSKTGSSPIEGLSTAEKAICEIYADLLMCSPSDLALDSDFFEMGGDSLKAGRLLSLLRRRFQVRIPIATLFQNSKVCQIRNFIDEAQATNKKLYNNKAEITTPLSGFTETYSSTYFPLLLLQLVPMVFLYPMKQALRWTSFLYILANLTLLWPSQTLIIERYITLLASIFLANVVLRICSPFVGIMIKWVVIGRYEEGLYPIWGPYHTRWWFVEKSLSIWGKGLFSYTDYTRILYYRLLGAKIGEGVVIGENTTLGEYDLLDIRDGAELNGCICRPFSVERNTSMYLARISLGRNSSVGLKSVIAPGAVVPDDTCIGPNSSSWEMQDANESNRDLSSEKIPKPHPILSLLLGLPVQLLVGLLTRLPWMAGLVGIVITEPAKSLDEVSTVISWFAQGKRVAFHFLARVLSVSVGPFVLFASIVLVKLVLDKLIGKTKPGPAASRSQMQKFRMSLLSSLLPKGDISKLTELFGSHYEITSLAVRALGGTVGSRVYWPGTGPIVQDFDLLDIGDNVVFGSHSQIITSDATGSDHVRIGDGAMIADRVIMLPGATVGTNAVLGSGALARRNGTYPSDTIWVGSKGGDSICLTTTSSKSTYNCRTAVNSRRDTPTSMKQSFEKSTKSGGVESASEINIMSGSMVSKALEPKLTRTTTKITIIDDSCPTSLSKQLPSTKKESSTTPSTSKPFGRAFYDHQARYHVLGIPSIFLYSTSTNIFVTIYWNIPAIASIQILAHVMPLHPCAFSVRPLTIYGLMSACISTLLIVQAIFALIITIGAKWTLMGRRKPGNYDWDKSPYCQRWQILLTIERLRRCCFSGHGILSLLTSTYYLTLYFRALGARIGSHCALFASGATNLILTEPDLLTLGDRVAVDDASLVGHLNSRGHFSLNELVVGRGSVLRTGSRVLSGGIVGEGSVLLEHTLVMAGDRVDEGSTVQGWPAEEIQGKVI